MHRVRKTGAVATVTVGLCLAFSLPAFAGNGWGTVTCGEDGGPSCDLGAGRDGTKPAPPQHQPAPKPGQPGGRDGGKATPPLGDRLLGGNSNLAHCSYVRSGFQPPANGVQTVAFHPVTGRSTDAQLISVVAPRRRGSVVAQGPGQGGAWYSYQCSGPGIRDGLYRAPVWMPDGQPPGAAAPLPSPQEMAQRARSQLRLPGPTIMSNPAGTQLVTLPTWLWLDRATWSTQAATASVPGVSVTAVATPTSVAWSMGDGINVTCAGPGTPFPAGGDAAASSPDCGHTYHRSSASAPGQQFPATATVHWTVTWSGAGAAGTFPDMTTSANTAFRVAEAQALGTGPR
jgi:hypothetical protein